MTLSKQVPFPCCPMPSRCSSGAGRPKLKLIQPGILGTISTCPISEFLTPLWACAHEICHTACLSKQKVKSWNCSWFLCVSWPGFLPATLNPQAHTYQNLWRNSQSFAQEYNHNFQTWQVSLMSDCLRFQIHERTTHWTMIRQDPKTHNHVQKNGGTCLHPVTWNEYSQ